MSDLELSFALDFSCARARDLSLGALLHMFVHVYVRVGVRLGGWRRDVIFGLCTSGPRRS